MDGTDALDTTVGSDPVGTDALDGSDALDGTDRSVGSDALDGTDRSVGSDALDGTDRSIGSDAFDGTDRSVGFDRLDGFDQLVGFDCSTGSIASDETPLGLAFSPLMKRHSTWHSRLLFDLAFLPVTRSGKSGTLAHRSVCYLIWHSCLRFDKPFLRYSTRHSCPPLDLALMPVAVTVTLSWNLHLFGCVWRHRSRSFRGGEAYC